MANSLSSRISVVDLLPLVAVVLMLFVCAYEVLDAAVFTEMADEAAVALVLSTKLPKLYPRVSDDDGVVAVVVVVDEFAVVRLRKKVQTRNCN